MKKKIALLLAAILMLPSIGVFAASDNSLSRGEVGTYPRALIFEEGGLASGYLDLFPDSDPSDSEKIVYAVDGTTANIKLKDDAAAGSVFKVSLDNARWFFRSTRNDAVAPGVLEGLQNFLADSINVNTDGSFSSFKDVASTNMSREFANDLIKVSSSIIGDKRIPVANTDFTNSISGVKALLEATTTTKFGVGFINSNQLSTYDTTKGIFFPTSNTYVAVDPTAKKVLYTMSLGSDNSSVATITLYEKVTVGTNIKIPLVSLISNAEGDVNVNIAAGSNYSVVTPQKLRYGTTATTATETTVANEDKVVSKYNFQLETISIKERIPNSLKQGVIVLEAPYGYTFADPKAKLNTTIEGNDRPFVKASGGLFFRNNSTVKVNSGDANSFMTYGSSDHSKDLQDAKDKIYINTSNSIDGLGLQQSGKITGTLDIKGLQLIAAEYAPYDSSVKLHIIGDGVTEEDFEIGTRADWSTSLKLATGTKVTSLINGRYVDSTSSSEFDQEHKTASVVFSEKVVASWWSLRETEFTLTDGAKFRRVDITSDTNFDYSSGGALLKGKYYPKADKSNQYVDLNANRLRLTDLNIQKDKIASFTMDMWVSVRAGFEGDIALSIGGNEILKATPPVVIAKAVSPVTIKAEVKELKIGYQWQQVSDILLSENAPGILRKGKTVRFFIDDGITGRDSIAFAPDFVTELNQDTKLRPSKPTVNGNGEIEFNVEVPSYGTAASIKLSNVFVKIDRTVPETNNRPYKVVVAGNAIVENYLATITVADPKFSVQGLGTDYINIVSPADEKAGLGLQVPVRVTIGANEAIVGKDATSKKITMDTAAYISAESNSTMVPVRFISQALGIPDNQLIWDNAERTVTIYNGSKVVQFKIGSSELAINGIKTNMYSLDTPPLKVSAEIKDGRSFLPLRALGVSLGVEVGWDNETKTAIFNPGLLTQNAATATASATATTAPATGTTAPATTAPATATA